MDATNDAVMPVMTMTAGTCLAAAWRAYGRRRAEAGLREPALWGAFAGVFLVFVAMKVQRLTDWVEQAGRAEARAGGIYGQRHPWQLLLVLGAVLLGVLLALWLAQHVADGWRRYRWPLIGAGIIVCFGVIRMVSLHEIDAWPGVLMWAKGLVEIAGSGMAAWGAIQRMRDLGTDRPVPASSGASRPRDRAGSAIAWAVCLQMILLAHGPLLAYATLQLWAREAYQFFPFAWSAALVLAFLRLRQAEPGQPSMFGAAVLLMLGLAMLLVATLAWSWALAMVALPVNLAAVVLALGGRRLLRSAVPAIGAYLTTVPPPFGLDSQVLTALRQVAVAWSGRLLDAVGVLHVVNGNVIEIPGHRLFVSEACSGIHSAVSSMAFAVIAALFLRRGALHVFLLALLGILLAIVGNILRIALGAALLQGWGYDIITGWPHATAGLLIFAFCTALILSADQLLAFFLRPVQEKPVSRRWGPFPWPRLTWSMQAMAALALVATVAGTILIAPRVTWSAPTWGQTSLPPTARFTLPDTIGPWTRMPLPPGLNAETEAVKSDLWPYASGPLHVVVALDYPYPQYHDLALCYQVQGWNVSSRRLATDALGPIEELELARSSGNASLFFASFDERGRWLVANQDRSLKDRVIRRLTDLDRPEVDPRPCYQMQLLTNRNDPLSAEDRAQIEQLFREARAALSRQVLDQMAPH